MDKLARRQPGQRPGFEFDLPHATTITARLWEGELIKSALASGKSMRQRPPVKRDDMAG
jgi:hypothetical protein